MGKQQKIHQQDTIPAAGLVDSSGSTTDTAASNSTKEAANKETKVDKIRDIIFGSEMRAYEGRFNQLDNRLSLEVERIREDITERMEKLESFIKDQFNRTADNLNNEKHARTEALEANEKIINTVEKACSEKVSQLNDQLVKENAALRQLLHDQINNVLDKISRSEVRINDQINRQTMQLSNNKVGRADLADLFSEVSMRLNADLIIETPALND